MQAAEFFWLLVACFIAGCIAAGTFAGGVTVCVLVPALYFLMQISFAAVKRGILL